MLQKNADLSTKICRKVLSSFESELSKQVGRFEFESMQQFEDAVALLRVSYL